MIQQSRYDENSKVKPEIQGIFMHRPPLMFSIKEVMNFWANAYKDNKTRCFGGRVPGEDRDVNKDIESAITYLREGRAWKSQCPGFGFQYLGSFIVDNLGT